MQPGAERSPPPPLDPKVEGRLLEGEEGGGKAMGSQIDRRKKLFKCHQPGLNQPCPAAMKSQFIYLFIWGGGVSPPSPSLSGLTSLR